MYIKHLVLCAKLASLLDFQRYSVQAKKSLVRIVNIIYTLSGSETAEQQSERVCIFSRLALFV